QALQRTVSRIRWRSHARDRLRAVAAEPAPLQVVYSCGFQAPRRRGDRDLGAVRGRPRLHGTGRGDGAGRVLAPARALLRNCRRRPRNDGPRAADSRAPRKGSDPRRVGRARRGSRDRVKVIDAVVLRGGVEIENPLETALEFVEAYSAYDSHDSRAPHTFDES